MSISVSTRQPYQPRSEPTTRSMPMRATTSGTHVGVDGRFISDPFVANICPTCRDAGRHFLYPDTYLDGIGESLEVIADLARGGDVGE